MPAPRAAAHDPFAGSSWTLLSLASDAAVLWAAVTAAAHFAPRGPIAPGASWLLVVLAVATIARLGMRQMYGERPSRLQALDTIREAVTAGAVGTLGTLALAALVDPDPATTSGLLVAGGLGTAGLTTLRLALLAAQHRARARGLSGKRTLIVGAGWVGAQLEKRLLERPGLGLHPIGFLDADPAPAFRDLGASGPVLGGPADLGDIAARTGVEHVIVAFSSAPDSTVLPVIRQSRSSASRSPWCRGCSRRQRPPVGRRTSAAWPCAGCRRRTRARCRSRSSTLVDRVLAAVGSSSCPPCWSSSRRPCAPPRRAPCCFASAAWAATGRTSTS